MMRKAHLSEWKSSDAEQRFREREDALMQTRMTEAPTALDVETHLGPTRAYYWAGSGEPVVFLHGAGGAGATWGEYVERRGGRAMFAIDTIGDVGRSRQQVAVENVGDLSLWLDQTLTGLGLERA